MTFTNVAKKFNRANRPISRSAVVRHSKHVLTPGPNGYRPRGGAAGPAIEGKSLLERVEQLITQQQAIVDQAKTSGQLIAAIAALREIRANLEMLGKLSGELANANINFYAIDITESRIKEFFDATKLRAPQLSNFVQEQAREQFGYAPPKVHIHFVAPPKRDQHGDLLLEAENRTG